MVLRLPRLRTADVLSDQSGRASVPLVRFWETTCRAIEAHEATQGEILVSLQEQIDRLSAILAGTGEPFTGLLVGSQDVKAFLDKTDGEKIVSTSALQSGVVVTDTMAAQAVTNEVSVNTAASIPLNGTADVVVQSVTYESQGYPLEVRSNFFVTVWHPSGGDISIRIRVIRSPGVVVFDQTIDAIGGDNFQGWQTPILIEALPTGTYTWQTVVSLSTSSGIDTQNAQGRFMGVREYKR